MIKEEIEVEVIYPERLKFDVTLRLINIRDTCSNLWRISSELNRKDNKTNQYLSASKIQAQIILFFVTQIK